MRPAPVMEDLEVRRLMAGTPAPTAAVLLGPLTTGSRWVYRGADGSTFTQRIVGRVRVGGKSAVQTETFIPDPVVPGTQGEFVALTDQAAVRYRSTAGSDEKRTGTGWHTVTLYAPAGPVYPTKLEAGKTYAYSYTGKLYTSNYTPAGKGSGAYDYAYDYTVKLVSAALQKVRVAAGTFKAYLIRFTLSAVDTTGGRNAVMNKLAVQQWVAPGVGIVRRVTTYQYGSKDTTELVSYRIV